MEPHSWNVRSNEFRNCSGLRSLRLLAAPIGVLEATTGYPLLFPSLGPTIFLKARKPEQDSSRAYNVVAGHAIGVLAAVIAVFVTGAMAAPPVLSTNELPWPRLWAALIALPLTLLVQSIVRASHPPAAASCLLVTFGAFSVSWKSMAILAAGVLLTALIGEILRRIRVPWQTT